MKHLLLLAGIASFFFVNGQTQDTVWTLEECIERAEDQNLSLQISGLDVNAAEVRETRAQHSRWPSINASSNYGYNFGRTIDPTSNEFIATSLGFHSISVNAGMTIFNANRINNRIRQAKTDREIALLNFEQAKQDLALQVANLYLNALLAKENLSIARSQFENAENQAERSQRLVESGAQPRAALLEFEAETANREQQLISAENDVQLSLLQLKQALLIEAGEPFDVISPPEQMMIEGSSVEGPSTVYQEALKTQPSYTAAQLGLRAALLDKKIVSSGYYPTLSVGGNLNSNYSTEGRTLEGTMVVETPVPATFDGQSGILRLMSETPVFSEAGWLRQMDENLGYGVGLQLSIPIYNNNSVNADYQIAKLGEVRAEKQLALEEQSIRMEVEQALADLKAARKSYAAAQRAFEAADLAYENVNRQYEVGSISVYDLFDSQQRRQSAEIQMVLAKYDYTFRQKIVDFYLGKPIKL